MGDDALHKEARLARLTAALSARGIDDLGPGELRALKAWMEGRPAQLGDQRLPDAPTPQNRLRAPFVAWLVQQSNDPDAHPLNRIHLIGGWIEGPIDLAGQKVRVNLVFQRCRFSSNLVISDAVTGAMDFTGSALGVDPYRNTSIDARHLRASGDLRLRDMTTEGGVALAGAEIRGDLDLSGSRFGKRRASFHGYEFDVSVGAPAARVSGALTMLRPPPSGEMFSGVLNLHNAEVDVLQDVEACWPAPGNLFLNGFRYRLLGSIKAGAADAGRRGRWVRLQPAQDLRVDFKPQPFEQLARVLRQNGYALEARRIGVLHQRMLRWAGKVPLYLRPFHWLFGAVAGYGYWTSRVLLWAALVVALGAAVFEGAWRGGAFTPAQAEALLSASWAECLETAPIQTAQCFLQSSPSDDYEPFNAAFYALDVFLPVVELEQEAAWSPTPRRGEAWIGATSGYWAWVYRFVHELLGYVLTGFAVLGFARLAERD
ncbi:MAG: hypothetical protein AAF909_14905 [Pseudomonadota bacterium]